MEKLTLPSILLFSLVIYFTMTYRIGPGSTPYWFFGIIFGLLLAYLVVANKKIKDVLVWLLIILVIGSASFSAILVRHQTAPNYQVHDIILQQEAAIRFLINGKNPYSTTYFNTPLESWFYSDKEVNPALFHFVMMPWFIIFALPFYFLFISFAGFFDGRLPLIFLFFSTLILAWKLSRGNQEKKHLFLIWLAYNPATLGYFLEGRSDFFVFAFLFFSWYLLENGRFALAGIPLALSLATKQSAWPIIPLYFAFLWVKAKSNWRVLIKYLVPMVVVLVLVILPFFVWAPKAFLESTVFYLSGNAPHSYPVSGYGWGMVLRDKGVIKNNFAYYPFWIWQLAICLPVFVYLIWWLKKSVRVGRLITAYGILTMVFWYFSRYFNNSHLGYLSTIFITAYFWPDDKKP